MFCICSNSLYLLLRSHNETAPTLRWVVGAQQGSGCARTHAVIHTRTHLHSPSYASASCCARWPLLQEAVGCGTWHGRHMRSAHITFSQFLKFYAQSPQVNHPPAAHNVPPPLQISVRPTCRWPRILHVRDCSSRWSTRSRVSWPTQPSLSQSTKRNTIPSPLLCLSWQQLNSCTAKCGMARP
jgi:hypothetical protein